MHRYKLVFFIQLVVVAGVGAWFSSTDSRAAARFKTDITFTKDVAAILYKHCAECHRPADIAPFSLLTYKEARPWARAIREKVITRQMPPWYADSRYGDFENVQRLSAAEIDTIVKWVDQGAKEGDAKLLPPLADTAKEWRIGKPDKIFSMSEGFTIAPNAPDQYVYYTIPTAFREDKWIQAAEVHPGNKRVVHHVIAHILTPKALVRTKASGRESTSQNDDAANIFYQEGGLARVKMDAPVVDDGAALANGGAAFRRQINQPDADGFSILLASYAPGKPPDIFAPGTAKKIPAGSRLVLQLHYSAFRGAADKPQTDRTSVGVIFAKAPTEKAARTLTVPNHFFKIPPGAENHAVTAAFVFDEDVELINYMPHMHRRGKDMKYEVVYPDGRREVLLWVPRYNFNWQTTYRLKKPVPIPRGTRLIVTAHFDNSANNKYNPNPARAVRWGDPTDDEMMVGWLDYAVPKTP